MRERGLGIGHKAHQITPTHIGAHHHHAGGVLAVYFDRAVSGFELCHGAERHAVVVASRGAHRQAQLMKQSCGQAQTFRSAHDQRNAAPVFDDDPGGAAFNQRLQCVLYVFYRQPQSANGLAVQLNVQVLQAFVFDGLHIFIAGDGLQQGDCGFGQSVQLGHVGAKNFDGQVPAHAGQHLRCAHFYRLCVAEIDAGEICHHLANVIDQLFFVRVAPC